MVSYRLTKHSGFPSPTRQNPKSVCVCVCVKISVYLPREVIIHILIRLPSKSLLKFRCVCKSWLSLISSSDFASAHLLPSTSKPPLLLFRHFSFTPYCEELYSLRSDENDFTSLRDLNCPLNTHSFFFRVVGCCNGLICLSDDWFGYTGTSILWNPAIRRYLTLPRLTLRFNLSWVWI